LAGGEVGAASVVAELVVTRGGRRGGSSVFRSCAEADRVGGTVGGGRDTDDGTGGGGGGAGEGGIGEVSKG